MSGQNDASAPSCANNPDFAVICSFFEQFNEKFGLLFPSFQDLQLMIENTEEVPYGLVELHVKLLRKLKKSTSFDRWEKAVVKFAHTYSHQDAWELERFGYKKSNTEVKLRLLKNLLEAQFDGNAKFKVELNKALSSELRLQPLGRDLKGRRYWHLLDDDCNLRVYREDMDEETWEVVASDRESMVKLIETLTRKQNLESEDTSRDTSEESNTNSREAFPKNESNEPGEPGDPVVGEAIESPVLVICGEGNGADCETGNPGNETEEPVAVSAIDQSNDSDRTLESGQENNHELVIEEKNLKEQNLLPTNQDEGAAVVSESPNRIGPCDPGGADQNQLAATEVGIDSSSDPSTPIFNTVAKSDETLEDSSKHEIHKNEETNSPIPEASVSAENGQRDSVEPIREVIPETPKERADGHGNSEPIEAPQVDPVDSTPIEQIPGSQTNDRASNAEDHHDSQKTSNHTEEPESVSATSDLMTEEMKNTEPAILAGLKETDGEAGEVPKNAENQSTADEVGQVSSKSISEAEVLPHSAALSTAAAQANLTSNTPVEKDADIPEESTPHSSGLLGSKEANLETSSDSSNQEKSGMDSGGIEQKPVESHPEEILQAETSLPDTSVATSADAFDPEPAVLSETAERKGEITESKGLETPTNIPVNEETVTRIQNPSIEVHNEQNLTEVEEKLPDCDSSVMLARLQGESSGEEPNDVQKIHSEEEFTTKFVPIPETPQQNIQTEESTDLPKGPDSAGTVETSLPEVETTPQSSSLTDESNTQMEENRSPREGVESELQPTNLLKPGHTEMVQSVIEETQPEDGTLQHSPEENLPNMVNSLDVEAPDLKNKAEGQPESMETEDNTRPAEEPVGENGQPLEIQGDSDSVSVAPAEEKSHPEAEVSAGNMIDPKTNTLENKDSTVDGSDEPEKKAENYRAEEPIPKNEKPVEIKDDSGSISVAPVEDKVLSEAEENAYRDVKDPTLEGNGEPEDKIENRPAEEPIPDVEEKSHPEAQVSAEKGVDTGKHTPDVKNLEGNDEPEEKIKDHSAEESVPENVKLVETKEDSDSASMAPTEEKNHPEAEESVHPEMKDPTLEGNEEPEEKIEDLPAKEPFPESVKPIETKKDSESVLMAPEEEKNHSKAEEKAHPEAEVLAENMTDPEMNTPDKEDPTVESKYEPEKNTGDHRTESSASLTTRPESGLALDREPQNSEESLDAGETPTVPESLTGAGETHPEVPAASTSVPQNNAELPKFTEQNQQNSDVSLSEASSVPENQLPRAEVDEEAKRDEGNSGGCIAEPLKDTELVELEDTVDEKASSVRSTAEQVMECGLPPEEQAHNGENCSREGSARLKNNLVQEGKSSAALEESLAQITPAIEKAVTNPSGDNAAEDSETQVNLDGVQKNNSSMSNVENQPGAELTAEENRNGEKPSGEDVIKSGEKADGQRPHAVGKEDPSAITAEIRPEDGFVSDEIPQANDVRGSFVNPEKDGRDATKRNVFPEVESVAITAETPAEAGPFLDTNAQDDQKRSGKLQKAGKDQDNIDVVHIKDVQASEKAHTELRNIPEGQEASPAIRNSIPVLTENNKSPTLEPQQLASSSDSVDVKSRSKLTELTFDFDESAPLPQLPAILQKTPAAEDSGTAAKKGRGRPRSKRRGPDMVVAMQYQDDAGKTSETTPLRQSSRIAKLREREDEERRKLEAERLQRFKEEVERRERRRNQREERKKRHEEKLQRRQEKVSGKKKIVEELSEDSDDSSSTEEIPRKGRKEKKKKKKKKSNTPWDSSETSEESSESDDGLDDLHHVEEEEELVFKSDHEFSPESDLDADGDVAVPTRHARTAKPELAKKQRKTKPKETLKETEEEEDIDEEEEEEKVDDTNCQKCGQSDHPEWILLCDGCDNGWHASCLRPALLVVPEGDWFCPPCEHATLIDSLQERLEAYDYLLKEKEAEVLRQQTAAAAQAAEAQKVAVPSEEEEEEEEDDAPSGAEEKLAASGAEEESEDSDDDEEESESESTSDEEDGASDDAVPGRRQRRAALQANYSFKEYDAMIKSALQDENEEENHIGDNDGKEKAVDKTDDGDDEGNKISRGKRRISSGSSGDDDQPRPVRRKRVKRLNDLSATSSDNDSDESFKGASEASDSEEEDDSSAVSTDSFVVDDDSDSDVINVRDGRRGRNASPPSVRRSTRNPRKRIMVSDTSSSAEESSEVEPKRKRSNRNESWDESEESSSDASWGRGKKKAAAARPKAKKPSVRPPVSRPARPPRGGAARGRGRGARTHKNESDDEPFRTNVSVKKLKQKADPAEEKEDHEDSDQKRRSTRGRQVSYKEMISSGESQEEDEETSKKIAEFLSARIPGRSAGTGTRGRGRGRGSSSGIPFVQSAKPKLPLSGTAAVTAPQNNTQIPAPESESESRQSVTDDFSSAAAAATAAAAVYTTEDSQTSNEVQNLVIAAPPDAELLPTVLPEVADVTVVPEIPAVVETVLKPKVEVVPAPLPNLPPDLHVSRLIQQAPDSPKPKKEPPVVEPPEQLPPAPEPVIPPYSGVIKQVRHSLPPTLAMYPTGASSKTEHNLPTTSSVIRPYPTSAASPAASNSPTPGNPLSIQGLLSGTPVASTPSVLQQLPSSAASTPLRPYATTPHIISHAPYLPQPTYASPYSAIGGRNSFGPPAPAASRSPYPNLYPYPGYPPSLRHPGTFQHAGYPQAFAAAAAAAASAEEERRIYRVAQAGREGESPYDGVSSATKTAPPLEEVPGNTAAAGGAPGAQESEFGGLVSYFSSQQEDFGES